MNDERSLKSRLTSELKLYAWISLYLFVCFGVVLLYEASQSADRNTTALGVGTALVKALVIGKFILIGETLNPGTRVGAPTLVHRVAWRSLGMLVVLIVLKLVEELVVGMIDGKSVGSIFDELLAQSWLTMLGPSLLMLLILIPLMASIELGNAIGRDALKQILLDRGRET